MCLYIYAAHKYVSIRNQLEDVYHHFAGGYCRKPELDLEIVEVD